MHCIFCCMFLPGFIVYFYFEVDSVVCITSCKRLHLWQIGLVQSQWAERLKEETGHGQCHLRKSGNQRREGYEEEAVVEWKELDPAERQQRQREAE